LGPAEKIMKKKISSLLNQNQNPLLPPEPGTIHKVPVLKRGDN
jgi:hypothetical protein